MKTIAFTAALLIAAPLWAQQTEMKDMPGMPMPAPAGACKPAVVAGFEGWARGPGVPQLAIGRFADVALGPAEAVHFSPPLNRPPAPGNMGGVYALTLTKSGVYRFALGTGAWIDVIDSKSKPIPSSAHAHGPACSGIAKIVDYFLDPGDYLVQLSATNDPRIKVMLIGPIAPF